MRLYRGNCNSWSRKRDDPILAAMVTHKLNWDEKCEEQNA